MLVALLRLCVIYPVLLRYGVIDVLRGRQGAYRGQWLRYLNPFYYYYKQLSQGERLRLALQALGPIYVKFGQILSTRRDVLSADMADELAKLQDQVPAFDGATAEKIITETFNQPLDALFATFESQPLGSASIAQVHGATLANGDEVVVKILRPNIHRVVARDMRLLALLAQCLECLSADIKQIRLQDVVQEFKQTLAKELDLNFEAANASQLQRNMADVDWVIIPNVYWAYTRKNIAVFERVHAISIADEAALKAQGIDTPVLAEQIIQLFFTAVFEHNFFHADMHPGNIFVKKQADQLYFVLVDFGIMGTLHLSDQRYLAENLLAFYARDYQRVAELHIDSGWVPAATRVDDFADAIRTVSEPIFARKMSERSFGDLFLRLLQTARQFNMAILPQLILLQKTLVNVEGLARRLDPSIDIWQATQPYLEQWFKKRTSRKAIMQSLQGRSSRLLQLPELAMRALETFTANQSKILSHTEMLRETEQKIKTTRRKSFTTGAAITAAGGLAWFYLLN